MLPYETNMIIWYQSIFNIVPLGDTIHFYIEANVALYITICIVTHTINKVIASSENCLFSKQNTLICN